MAALQAALDDWYAMRLAEIDKSLNDSIKPPEKTRERLEKERDELLQGLGKPKDDGKAAKEKQKENTGKDVKDPKNKGKKPKDILKDKIAQALKDLQDCEANCPEGEASPTPTPTPTPGPIAEISPPPPFETQVPPLPPCFDTKAARASHRKTLEELQTKLGYLKKQYAAEYLTPPANDAWKEWGDKLKKAIDDVSDQLNKVDTVPVPCPTPTPTPTPSGGGGKGKKPTPTPPGKPKRAPRIATGGGNISLPQESFCLLIADNKILVDITGTGETIGHVADARITNLTDEPVEFAIPPAVLESRSGKNQNYGIPHTTEVVLQPHESKTIPLDGVCLDRHKPPVGKGVGDDLAFNDCDPDGRIPQGDSDRMLRISESVYQAADELEHDGKLKDIPYKDPENRKDIVKQWGTWVRMSEVTGDPPPTKDDLKKVVDKQVGKVPPDQRKKIDQGIDTIFEKIELTTEKAKDLEKENEDTESGPTGGGTVNVTNDTPTPAPETQEKKKKKKKDKPKKYPPEIQKWVDALHEYDETNYTKLRKELAYKIALRKWALEHSQHYKELNDAVGKAAQNINDANKNGKATQGDWDNLTKAKEELEKFEKEVAKDFQKTEVGKGLFKEFADAEDIANKAKARVDEAGKNIDDEVKKAILEKKED